MYPGNQQIHNQFGPQIHNQQAQQFRNQQMQQFNNQQAQQVKNQQVQYVNQQVGLVKNQQVEQIVIENDDENIMKTQISPESKYLICIQKNKQDYFKFYTINPQNNAESVETVFITNGIICDGYKSRYNQHSASPPQNLKTVIMVGCQADCQAEHQLNFHNVRIDFVAHIELCDQNCKSLMNNENNLGRRIIELQPDFLIQQLSILTVVGKEYKNRIISKYLERNQQKSDLILNALQKYSMLQDLVNSVEIQTCQVLRELTTNFRPSVIDNALVQAQQPEKQRQIILVSEKFEQSQDSNNVKLDQIHKEMKKCNQDIQDLTLSADSAQKLNCSSVQQLCTKIQEQNQQIKIQNNSITQLQQQIKNLQQQIQNQSNEMTNQFAIQLMVMSQQFSQQQKQVLQILKVMGNKKQQ